MGRNYYIMLSRIQNLSSVSLLLEENFAVSIVDANGLITYVNQVFCDITKYRAEELIGKTYGFLNSDYSEETTFLQIKNEILNHKVSHQKVKSHAKDGTPFWIQATFVPVFDDNRQIIQYISFDIDITSKVLMNENYKNALLDFHNIENALNQSTIVAITDRKGLITYANDKFCELSQYPLDELIGQTHRIVNSGHHPKSFFIEMWQTIENGEIWTGDVKNRSKDGKSYWVNTTIVPLLNNKGIPYQYIAIRSDITARKEAEQSLEIALKNDFRQTVKNLQNAIFKYTYDDEGKILFTLMEGKIAQVLGITAEKINMRKVEYSFSKKELTRIVRNLTKGLEGKAVQFELYLHGYTFLVYLSPISVDGEVVEVVGTAIDISERKEAEKLVEHMAFFDHLTGLPNRRLFQKKVKEEIAQALEDNTQFAIMFIDLDRFKNVNDSMGHPIGDQLLIAVGQRLLKSVRKNDFVARYGGDEYVILLPSCQQSEADTIAARILDELEYPLTFQNIDLFVTSSIGISIFPEDGHDYEALTANADSAMYLAKEKGKNNYQFFTEDLRRDIIEKMTLERELRHALIKNQFLLYYQPQIDLKTGQMTGLEALIRWHHPSKGIISPTDFIPIAEETGLIVPIGQWVLETACAQIKKWQEAHFPQLQISINVSFVQFMQTNFAKLVEETLVKTGLQPHYLNLEITESMTSDALNCQTTLYQLRKIGINISIDDFGTGFSSLSYISNFPITHLKIDQVFVQGTSTSNKAIVKTIISLAKNLNLKVIAEGVETVDQARFLKDLDCDEVQGYYYFRPLPEEQVTALLAISNYNPVK